VPILRLVAEGVGPFEKLDLDLSDGKGNPHLGPHILAGVNGSGKSTVLKTIAWVLDRQGWGFDHQEWKHSLTGHAVSRAGLALKPPGAGLAVEGVGLNPPMDDDAWLNAWLRDQGFGKWDPSFDGEFTPQRPGRPLRYSDGLREPLPYDLKWLRGWGAGSGFDLHRSWIGAVAAYAPSPKLRYLAHPDTTKSPSSPFENALAFGETVRNDLVQAWLANLHSRPAIAREMKQPAEKYVQALARFESALRLIYEDRRRLVPELEPSLHPEIQVGSQRLNFSQLPDGVRATIGWLSDFMMRQDLMQWDPRLNGKRPGLLLLDEVETHLHPQWQRTLLPAMREALPDVQIIVTSHSPFVISSCPGSRVHVFDVDRDGHAFLKQSCDEPIGHSVMTILKDIFGVESRFDVRTEKELDEWYQLSRREAVGRLSASDRRRMDELTKALSERSESLKGIVFKPSGLSGSIESVLRAVGGSAAPPPRSRAKPRQKKAS
jgi:hypothetical protein